MTRFVVFALALLCVLACTVRAQNSPSCYVTSKFDASNLETQIDQPYVSFVVEFPGTYTVTGDTSNNKDFYRGAFHFFNASNNVQLFPLSDDPTITSSLGVTSIRFRTVYAPVQVGSVKLKYTQQLCQSIRIRFNDTAVTSLDLTCAPRRLNTAYRANLHGSHVAIYFSKPVAPCNSNGTDLIPNSWFSLASVVCDAGLSNCLSMANQGPCVGAGLLPLNNRRMIYTCIGNGNFSSDMIRATYTILENRLCDVSDNHTVSSYGQGETFKLHLYPSVELSQYDTFVVHAQPQVSDPTYYDRVHVHLGFPVVSWTNFSTSVPYIYIKHNLVTAATRCYVSSLLTDVIAVFTCTPFRPLAHETMQYVWIGQLIHKMPGSNSIALRVMPHDDELDANEADGGEVFTSARAHRITGFYWIDANTVRVDTSHALINVPKVTNFRVYLTSGVICYNASNITRADGSQTIFYLKFNAANALPDPDDVPLSAYHESGFIAANNVHFLAEPQSVSADLPSTSTTADPDDLSSWNYTVWMLGWVALGVAGLAVLWYGYKYMFDGNSKARRSGYRKT